MSKQRTDNLSIPPAIRLIGLGYRTKVGKSTLADAFCQSHAGWIRMSIAEVLKRTARSILRQPIDEDFKDKIIGKDTGRQFLRDLAMFLRDYLGHDYFIVNMDLRQELVRGLKIIIDDVRQPEEVDYIHKLGGVCIKVNRPTAFSSNHELETVGRFGAWDAELNNTSSIFVGLTLFEEILLRLEPPAPDDLMLSVINSMRHPDPEISQ